MANLYDDDIINKYLQDKLSQQVSDPEKTLDQQTFDFIKQHEGDKNVVYDDLNPNKSASTIEGTPTIGYGTTLSPKELAAGVVKTASGDVDISKPISDSDKQKMYVDDINQVKRQLANKINPDLMTTGQQVAAQSRAYNLGTEGAFGKDTKIGQLLAAAKADPLNASTYLNKMPAYMDEITSKGKVLPGLIDRRLAEADESQKSMSGISDLKKLDNTTIQEAKKLSPTGEINYAPPQQEELLKQATERSEQGFPKQLEEYDRTGKPPSRKLASETKKPSDIESIIAEYKAALEAANKKMELDPEELNKAKWMDALTGISRNIIQAGDSKQPLPDQTNYAAQYLNQAQQQRAGVKEGLDARAKLLQMYRGLNKGSGLTPYQQQMYELKKEQRIDKDVQKLGSDIKDTQKLVYAYDNIDEQLGFPLDELEVKDNKIFRGKEKIDLPGVSIPLLGRTTFYDSKADDLSTAIQKIFNTRIKDTSGSAVSNQEMENLQKEFATGKFNTEASMIKALKDYKIAVANALKDREAGFDPQVVNIYKDRGGTTSASFKSSQKEEAKFPMQVRKSLPNGKTQVATVSNEADLKSAREKGFN